MKFFNNFFFNLVFNKKKYLGNLYLIFNIAVLHLATFNGFKDVVQELLSHDGIDINIKDITMPNKFILFKSNFLIVKLKNELFLGFHS